jgi:para-nitrobenzyl esterase
MLPSGVSAFLGVPYAASPFGSRRLLPPQPHASWAGERDATRYGPTCPKGDYPQHSAELFAEVEIPGDDCLNLNIWTPDAGGSGLPVLVWLHGGMFLNGSGSVPGYRGTSFARDGIVCVTINYRLGAEGFLFLKDGTANLGLLDQMAALQWVQRNIAAFGGDPSIVTVAGQSAGGMSALTLMTMPAARGLFCRVIAQSAAVQQVLTREFAAEVTAVLAERLEIQETREAFSRIPPKLLVHEAVTASARQNPADPASWDRLAFAPVVDGTSLPRPPIEAIRRGAGAGIDLLVGSNRDDTRIGLVPTGLIDSIEPPMLTAVADAFRLPVGTIDCYRKSRPGASAGELLAAVLTDRSLRVPAIRIAEARTAGGAADTWMYRFDHGSSRFEGRLGAAHGVELPFVFDLLDEESGHALIGAEPAQSVAEVAHGAWVRFIADGDPGWPRYDLQCRATGLIDEAISVADDPDGEERAAWETRAGSPVRC